MYTALAIIIGYVVVVRFFLKVASHFKKQDEKINETFPNPYDGYWDCWECWN